MYIGFGYDLCTTEFCMMWIWELQIPFLILQFLAFKHLCWVLRSVGGNLMKNTNNNGIMLIMQSSHYNYNRQITYLLLHQTIMVNYVSTMTLQNTTNISSLDIIKLDNAALLNSLSQSLNLQKFNISTIKMSESISCILHGIPNTVYG